MNTPLPGLVAPTGPSEVEESRTKRLQRQQSRFRDRGGIFVPNANNGLLDILLGKKKLSPLKRRSRSRSVSASPIKRRQSVAPSARKTGGKKTPAKKKPSKAKSAAEEDEGTEQPVAGPSRLEAEKPSTKGASRQGKKPAEDDDAPKCKTIHTTKDDDSTASKRKGATKQTTKDTKPTTKRKTAKSTAPDDPPDDGAAPKKGTTASKTKVARSANADAEVEDDVPAETKSKTTTTKSRAKKRASTAPSAAKATTGKGKSKAKPKSTPGDEEEEEPPPSRAKRGRVTKASQAYAELTDDAEAEAPKARAKGRGKQVKSTTLSRKRDALDEEDGEGPPAKRTKATAAPRADVAPPVKQRLEAIPEEDEGGAETEGVSPVKTPVAAPARDRDVSTSDVKAKTGDKSKKRAREREDEDLDPDAAVETKRKRVKVIEADETPVVNRAAAKPKRNPASSTKEVAKGKGKRARTQSGTLKENSEEPDVPVAAKLKPAPIVRRRGPPQSVLDRLRAQAGVQTLVDDDEQPDELDFLS